MFKYLYYTNSLVNANFNVKWGMGTFWKCILVKFELNELVLTKDLLTAKGKVNSSSINASNTEDQNFLMSFTITLVCTDITVLFLTVIKALMIHYCIFPKTSYHHICDLEFPTQCQPLIPTGVICSSIFQWGIVHLSCWIESFKELQEIVRTKSYFLLSHK